MVTKLVSNKSTNRSKSTEMVSLYSDTDSECDYLVDRDRLMFATGANTGCAFASRILSSLFNDVNELYGKSWSSTKNE